MSKLRFGITCLSLVLVFTSCLNIEYTSPQPFLSKNLQEFPKELQGDWYDVYLKDGDTSETFHIGVDAHGFVVENTEKLEIKRRYYGLSDSVQLRKKKDVYMLNCREDNMWKISIIQVLENGDIKYVDPLNLNLLLTDPHLKVSQAYYKKNSVTISKDSLEHADVDHVIFSGKMTYKTLQKCLNEEEYTVFKRNGEIINF